jgi:hypothetical protein
VQVTEGDVYCLGRVLINAQIAAPALSPGQLGSLSKKTPWNLIDASIMLVAAAAVRSEGWLSVDTIEDIAVLGALLLFGSLSLGVIVLIY